MEYRHLVGLDTLTYEHPYDRKVLNMLNGKTGFTAATNAIMNLSYVKWQLVALKGGHFQVTPESCESLYALIKDVANTLDVSPIPEIYTEWKYDINGRTFGFGDDTLIVLNSGTVDLLTDEELRFVVGHEFGHIKSGHVIKHMMAQMLNIAVGTVPVIGNLADPIKYLLLYWNRLSEFTADRAGLLACHDIDVALNEIIKVAGLPYKYFGNNVKESFLKQAESFSLDLNDITDQTVKMITIATSNHPWTVMRAAELIKWYESGEYQKVMDTNKPDICIWPDCAKPIPKGAEYCPYCDRKQHF